MELIKSVFQVTITQDQSWFSKNWNRGLGANEVVFLVPAAIFLVPENFLSANFVSVKKNCPLTSHPQNKK